MSWKHKSLLTSLGQGENAFTSTICLSDLQHLAALAHLPMPARSSKETFQAATIQAAYVGLENPSCVFLLLALSPVQVCPNFAFSTSLRGEILSQDA